MEIERIQVKLSFNDVSQLKILANSVMPVLNNKMSAIKNSFSFFFGSPLMAATDSVFVFHLILF